MLITKEQQEAWVAEYDSEHSVFATVGFVKGIEKALTEVAKGCIDKQVAINFAQHLLKDYSTIEVTAETLNNFLTINQP